LPPLRISIHIFGGDEYGVGRYLPEAATVQQMPGRDAYLDGPVGRSVAD
jgi:hypothetical protein